MYLNIIPTLNNVFPKLELISKNSNIKETKQRDLNARLKML